MSKSVIAWFGILVGALLGLGCGGGGGGGSPPTTTHDLNGSYSYSLTPGALTGNGAEDCYPSEAATGTVDVTWTKGSNQCQLVVDGSDTYTATVSGDTMSYARSETNYLDCETYQETFSIRMTSADAGSGSITWRCSWVYNGGNYSCSAKDTLAITRK